MGSTAATTTNDNDDDDDEKNKTAMVIAMASTCDFHACILNNRLNAFIHTHVSQIRISIQILGHYSYSSAAAVAAAVAHTISTKLCLPLRSHHAYLNVIAAAATATGWPCCQMPVVYVAAGFCERARAPRISPL